MEHVSHAVEGNVYPKNHCYSRGYHKNSMLLLEGKDKKKKIRRKKIRTVFSQCLKIWFGKECHNRETDDCFLISKLDIFSWGGDIYGEGWYRSILYFLPMLSIVRYW